MAIAVADIKRRFPLLAELPEDAIADQLSTVNRIYIREEVIPDEYFDLTTLLCTAHFLCLEVIQQSVITGIAGGTAKAESPQMIDFAGKKHWELTVYGIQLQDLLDTVPVDSAILIGR